MRMVSPSNPLTTPIQRKRALDHSTLNTSSNPPPSGRPDRELSEDIAYYFNYPSTEQEEEKERSSWCLSTLMYRFVGHVVTVDPCTRGKVPNTTLPLNEARSLELQSNRASEASLGGSNGIE